MTWIWDERIDIYQISCVYVQMTELTLNFSQVLKFDLGNNLPMRLPSAYSPMRA
ncbi:hypothetical protein SAMN05216319_0719 [Duganella sp. CF402]|nr:hypothetical protein EV582_2907 [Duganella sp. BK701]SEK95313.1 hypothetical protein SAMN05216319_0719 [Duganella sp. CF402]